MFECRGCKAKDKHLADLQSQIEMLNRLLFPPKRTQEIEFTDLEVDTLMNGEPVGPIADGMSEEVSALYRSEPIDSEI